MAPFSLSLAALLIVLSASLLSCVLSASYPFSVDLSVRHSTSGVRYAGANFASPQLLAWGVQASRVGGDDQTPYNWKSDTSNADNDFFWLRGTPYRPFQQSPQQGQSFVDVMLANTIAANATLFLLVPTAGWVDAGPVDDGCGSFPIDEYGHQQSEYQQWGNGVLLNGTQLRGDWHCYVPFELPDVLEWLRHVRQLVGEDNFDRHVVLQLDNEYDLCQPTCNTATARNDMPRPRVRSAPHDIHPAMVTYDELWSVTVTYASSIKAMWPAARIAGPISYGWCGWWWSELDGCVNNGTDYKTHNNMYLMPWYLQQLQRYFDATGIQLIDVIDNHYYPNLPADSSTPANRAAYFGEVRSWWDPSYTDPSWIGQCGERCGGPSVMALPRFHAWMRQYAPSLQLELAISEYAFGFDDSDETAAAATAESIAVLGLFNATWGLRWISPAPHTAAEQVWKLWHNWDGHGSSLYGEFAATHSPVGHNVTAYTLYNVDARQLYVLLFSHLEQPIDCARGDDSAVLVQHASTSATSAVTYELVPGAWNVTQGVKLAVHASGASSIAVDAAACAMPARSIRLIVVRDVSLSVGAVQRLYVPWEDERYAAVDWNEPLVAVDDSEYGRVAAHQLDALHKVRAGKAEQKRRYYQSAHSNVAAQ